VEFDDFPPALLQKSDEATTYFTRDMATIKYRLKEWDPDLCIYEVGSEQTLHFKQVFKAAEMMGWTKKMKLYHLPHGLIRWATGKFSTRKGDTIHLSEVVDKAMEEARAVADKSQVNKDLNHEEKEEMIKAVAIGAIKFTDLAQDPKKDIIFDWGRMMDLQGDSGPYLQYAYARCQSVLNKSKIVEQKNIENLPEEVKVEEMVLLRELFKFEEKIVEAGERYNPAIVAEYLLSVARKYNEFYGKHRIIGQP
ncbi:arginine--tRNA ligase, partial [Candidatus Shapirobacteria bacterium RBG_13_44_7]